MDLQIIAQNIRRLRADRRFSQKALAESSGVSLPAIKKLEGANVTPRVNTLQAVANALDVKLQELFIPVRELKTVRFRSNKKMRNRENILADISKWLDDFNYLEDTLKESKSFKLKEAREQLAKVDPVTAAEECRKALKLKATEPIHDICGLLESAGIKLKLISMASEGFFGLSVGEGDRGPAIVVNVWDRIPTERCIFSSAHELGHLILHSNAYDVTKAEEDMVEEREADMFASHFLMPDKGFRKEWNEAAGLAFVDRVFKVKRIFRVSYKTILMRLIECGAADSDIWKKFYWAHFKKYQTKLSNKKEPMGVSNEPFRIDSYDFFEDRLSLLTRKAVEKDRISLSRGAEILRINIEEMQDLFNNWEPVL